MNDSKVIFERYNQILLESRIDRYMGYFNDYFNQLDKKNCGDFEQLLNTEYAIELSSDLRNDYNRLKNSIYAISAIGHYQTSDLIKDIKEEFPNLL